MESNNDAEKLAALKAIQEARRKAKRPYDAIFDPENLLEFKLRNNRTGKIIVINFGE